MTVRINGGFRSSGSIAEIHHSFEDIIEFEVEKIGTLRNRLVRR